MTCRDCFNFNATHRWCSAVEDMVRNPDLHMRCPYWDGVPPDDGDDGIEDDRRLNEQREREV